MRRARLGLARWPRSELLPRRHLVRWECGLRRRRTRRCAKAATLAIWRWALRVTDGECERPRGAATMPICVQHSPHGSAWTLTLDVLEDQALIQGEHYILWNRLVGQRWIVTSARLDTVELNLAGLQVVPLGRRDLFPGPGRPFMAFSPLSEEAFAEAQTEALRLLAIHRGGTLGAQLACVPVALEWRRLRSNEEFIYDHRQPAPPTAGYVIDLVRKDHQFCRCSLSVYRRWYLPHGPDRSAWPWGSDGSRVTCRRSWTSKRSS